MAARLPGSLVVASYSTFVSIAPIGSYAPYSALPDGSLVTPALTEAIRSSNGMLFGLGAGLAFFIRNILVSFDYIRRGRIKHRYLFYALLLSQLLGPVGVVPITVAFFRPSDCTIVNCIASIAVFSSESLLISGILGVKAYRCLSDSLVVLLVIAAFQVSIIACALLDLISFQGMKDFTGSCTLNGHTSYIQIVFALFCAECIFLFVCFFFAIWKSSRTSAASGRLSIHIHSVGTEVPGQSAASNDRRGWWDYVPDVHKTKRSSPPDGVNSQVAPRRWQMPWFKSREPNKQEEVPAYAYQRKPSLPGPYPLKHPGFPSGGLRRNAPVHYDPDRGPPSASSPPMSTERLEKSIPRMELFKEAMRNELFHTAFIAGSCGVAAVLSSVGVNLGLVLGPGGWIGVNWLIISFLVIHSFGRVVRRHEREALLQHPSAWDPMYRAEQAFFPSSRERPSDTWRHWSTDNGPHRRITHADEDDITTHSCNKSPMEDGSTGRNDEEVLSLDGPSWRSSSSSSSSLTTTESITAATTPTMLSSVNTLPPDSDTPHYMRAQPPPSDHSGNAEAYRTTSCSSSSLP